MQTLEMLRQFNDFNLWANREFLRFFQNAVTPDAQAVKIFAHLLLAEKTWFERTRANPDTTGFDFWAGETVADCEKLFAENQRIFINFFADLSEEKLDATFHYKNSRGAAFENTVREALTHVFLHSVYHRGQVAQAVRLAGQAPPYTDFIQFLRTK
jgi:uncharacterized damage-inducible protein DinB